MEMYDILTKKKRGAPLTEEELDYFARGYLSGEIPDYQASALMMAVVLNGMTDEETVLLTKAIETSGDVLDLSHLGTLTVDKHSTGGVGDKTTPILAPIVAAAGGIVAKMSGRGLGHTGGTIDKLESIPGFRTAVSPEEFDRLVCEVGICVTAQSGDLAPLDKKLYALRDVTATVDSLPLIASSVMGKKLAGGSKSIVLDVKCGSGSFMKTKEDASALAKCMVDIGCKRGRRVSAIITDMDSPLGRFVGNSLEIKEAVAFLRGDREDDLYAVITALATEMLTLSLGVSREEAEELYKRVLEDGSALAKLRQWISTQGGDVGYIDNPDRFPTASVAHTVTAKGSGYIGAMDTELIGSASVTLGAGRVKKEDVIDPSAGICILKKTADRVSEGEPIAILYTNRPETVSEAEEKYLRAITTVGEPIEKRPPVLGRIIG